MGLTIELGWWLVPLAVTIISCGWAAWQSSKLERGTQGGFLPDMTPLVELFFWGPAVIVSLIAWLIYAGLT